MGGGFLLKGGGVSCFSPNRKKKRVGGLQDCRCGLCGGDKRENPPRGQRELGGVGKREFPAGYDAAEVVAPNVAPNICLQICFPAPPPCD